MATDPASDDPFAQIEGHRTFIRPKPGGWSAGRLADVEATGGTGAPREESAPPDHGLNPLLAVANRLLLLAPQIRQTRHVADPSALRQQLAQGIRDFVAEAQARGIAPERVMAARYVLCTVLDEAAADTPWGGSGVWGRHSLLASFHNEAFGGEKVFQLMARLAENPEANRDLLELIYAATALGFEGRYRIIDNGRAQLDLVREKLAQILKQQRGPYPQALAQHWAVQGSTRSKGLSWLPLAVTAAVAIVALAGVYTAFVYSLSSASEPVYARIQGLRLTPPVAPVAQPAPAPRLAQFLQSEIKAGHVAVRDEVDRSVITLRGEGLFAGGSATLTPEREALMMRIAEALARHGGSVLVTGHTDSTPIRTARFPSNWHLSEERAQNVQKLLVSGGVPAERVRAEGRADGEPLAANDTPANKALNRRVEITLMIARPQPARTATAPAPAPATASSGSGR
jgi:type VI secretion system protein ImpK